MGDLSGVWSNKPQVRKKYAIACLLQNTLAPSSVYGEKMSFKSTIISIISNNKIAMTPQEIREVVKKNHSEYYNTESQQRNVEKGHYNSIDNALLAQIYTTIKQEPFICLRDQRPIKVILPDNDIPEDDLLMEIEIDSEESIENNRGILYVLKTNTYTIEGKAILKIGITSGDIDLRIKQLYTTGVPYKFEIYKKYSVTGFIELERALHALLTKFRINPNREFFTEDALIFLENIIDIHNKIVSK